MKVKIKIEGKINDTYTFQQPEEGNILDELAAIIEEMAALAKAIKSGAAVLPTVKRAFERVLTIRQAERQEAYNIYYNDLNTMCYSCKKCGISCNGTICKTWTGCAMKN